jgi:hypothetical protein
MPRVLFTRETAREMALRSHAAMARRAASAPTSSPTIALARVARDPATVDLTAKSNYARDRLADALIKTVDLLTASPVRTGLTHVAERSDAMQGLIQSCARVFGWNDASGGQSILVLGTMKQALDVEVNAPDSCGPDTTTGSVRAIECNAQTPQDAANP